ncbi:MAG TPA: FtsX-like permease family protein, partial [Bdellovibrionales bacterium]|nr:FtsX-like permease family protein [Bdellovibrionales bacterium]
MIARLALKEIVSNWRFSLAFGINLGLGLFGFVLLSTFHGAIRGSFEAQSRSLLTADLAVSARRLLTEDELRNARKTIETGGGLTGQTEVIEMYSMAQAGGASRLVEIVAIQDAFPLYGELRLSDRSIITSESAKPILAAGETWVSQELAIQLSLRPGDAIRLGELEARVAAVVEHDASSGWRGFSFAPKLYIGRGSLDKTGLVRKGSTLSHDVLFRVTPQTDVEALVRALNEALPDPGIRVVSHLTAGEQMTRTLSYLTDYLGLVSLVGLFLAALGSGYLFQSFLSRRLREIATLISLGATHTKAIAVYLLQPMLLGLVSALFAVAASYAAMPQIKSLVDRAMNADLRIDAALTQILPTLGTAIFTGIAMSVFVCLPLAVQIRRLKPSVLFQESAAPSIGWSVDRASVLAALPIGVFAYFISVWQANSWRVGSLFFFGLLASAALLGILAALILTRLKTARAASPITRIALRYLAKNRLSTVSAFLAIGLGALLMNLLPQLQQSIESEIEQPEVSSVPSLFLFDIQEDQVERLKETLKAEGAGVMQSSALVRARLESINGEPFEKPLDMSQTTTREEQQEAATRNRGFNLTFREGLTESETLMEGRAFTGPFSGDAGALPQISVEFRFAERLGVKLGDVLKFSIESVPVEGQVTSLRRVRWTSFQPNFFVVFQPGVLDDAPKTYLASVQKLSLEERARIQSRIVREFNNVSIIDITQLVQKMLGAFEQMALAIRLMAVLAVLAGLVVLFSIANHQARARRAEVQLLKILGGGTGDVAKIFLIEF